MRAIVQNAYGSTEVLRLAEIEKPDSAAKVELVRSIGADHVIDYTREDFADGSHRYDLILDIGGNSRLSRLRRVAEARFRSLQTTLSTWQTSSGLECSC